MDGGVKHSLVQFLYLFAKGYAIQLCLAEVVVIESHCTVEQILCLFPTANSGKLLNHFGIVNSYCIVTLLIH